MLYDWCTWDVEYNTMVQEVRAKLVSLATKKEEKYTTVLMQGSGTFSVEAVIGSVIPKNGKLLVCTNGAYGKRIVQMAEMLHANKCIQGVPGFGFVIAKRDELLKCKGQARSLSLDLYDQWETMENQNGKWRFTSPTHVVHAFYKALLELEEEGGISARYNRSYNNQKLLVNRMGEIGFRALVDEEYQSPIITSFIYPKENFEFQQLYSELKRYGFVIYPGKISKVDTFRIGNIGDVHEEDINRLVDSIAKGVVIG